MSSSASSAGRLSSAARGVPYIESAHEVAAEGAALKDVELRTVVILELHVGVCVCACAYIYAQIYTHRLFIQNIYRERYIYIYIERERERQRALSLSLLMHTFYLLIQTCSRNVEEPTEHANVHMCVCLYVRDMVCTPISKCFSHTYMHI